MNGASLKELWRWELKRIGRSPLLWIVLATLAVSFILGAQNSARLLAHQARAEQATVAAQRAHDADLAQRAQAYAAPVTADAPAVPYWQDPTNISGFSQYQVFRHALKPALALAPLSDGVNDVAPTRLRIALNTPFGFSDTYDFENPRALAAGRFDLAFALVYLLPIGFILLFGLLATVERDRGMLRLIAAQGTSPRIWLAARVAALLTWALPVVLASMVIALVLAGADVRAGSAELLAAVGLVTAYVLFWTGVAVAILVPMPGAAAAIGLQVGVWMALAFGLPIAGAMLSQGFDPAPSPIVAVDAERRIADTLQADRDAIVAEVFAARADLRGGRDQAAKLDHATRLTFLTPETERRLTPLRHAAQAHRNRQAGIADIAGYLAPPVGLEAKLAILAGADPARHRRFEDQALAYQLALRARFYPLVQREIANPSPILEPVRRGRFNFDPTQRLPDFAMRDQGAMERVGAILPLMAWLSFLGMALGVVGLRSARVWPRDI